MNGQDDGVTKELPVSSPNGADRRSGSPVSPRMTRSVSPNLKVSPLSPKTPNLSETKNLRPSSPKDSTRIKIGGKEVDRSAIPKIPLSPRTESRALNPSRPTMKPPDHLTNRLTKPIKRQNPLSFPVSSPTNGEAVNSSSSYTRGKMTDPMTYAPSTGSSIPINRVVSPRSQDKGQIVVAQPVSPDTFAPRSPRERTGISALGKHPNGSRGPSQAEEKRSPVPPGRRLKSPLSPISRQPSTSPEPKQGVFDRVKPPVKSPGIGERPVSPSYSKPIPQYTSKPNAPRREISSPISSLASPMGNQIMPKTKPLTNPVTTRSIKPETAGLGESKVTPPGHLNRSTLLHQEKSPIRDSVRPPNQEEPQREKSPTREDFPRREKSPTREEPVSRKTQEKSSPFKYGPPTVRNSEETTLQKNSPVSIRRSPPVMTVRDSSAKVSQMGPSPEKSPSKESPTSVPKATPSPPTRRPQSRNSSPSLATTKIKSPRTVRVRTPEQGSKELFSPKDLDNVFVMPAPRETGVPQQNIREIIMSPNSRDAMKMTPQGFGDNVRSSTFRHQPETISTAVSPNVIRPRSPTTRIMSPRDEAPRPMSPRDAVPRRARADSGSITSPAIIPEHFRTPKWEEITQVRSRTITPEYAPTFRVEEDSIVEQSPISRRRRMRTQLQSPVKKRTSHHKRSIKTPHRRTRKKRRAVTPEPEAYYNPQLNARQRPRPDYARMNLEESELYRNDINNRLNDIRDSYQKLKVPEYGENVPLDTIHTVFEQYCEKVQIENEVIKYKWILSFLFLILEHGLIHFFRIDASGFSKMQAGNMPQYEYFLRQMCQSNGGAGVGSDWSPEMKIGIIAGVQLILLIFINKFIPSSVPREYINEGLKLIGSFISNENIGPLDDGSRAGLPMVPESDLGVLAGFDPADITKIGGDMLGNFIKPKQNPANQSPVEAPTRARRRTRNRRGPQHGT